MPKGIGYPKKGKKVKKTASVGTRVRKLRAKGKKKSGRA